MYKKFDDESLVCFKILEKTELTNSFITISTQPKRKLCC